MSHSASQVVQLSFRYSEEEYLAGIRCYFWHSPFVLLRVTATYVLFLAGLIALISLMGFSLPAWFYLALTGIGAVAWFHGSVVDRPRAYFRGDPKFRDEYHLTFTDSGMEFHTQNLSSRVVWNFYSGVMENDSFYLLIYGTNIHALSIIPKRAFQSGNQETTFRQILRRNVDPGLKLATGESQYVPQHLEPPDWR